MLAITPAVAAAIGTAVAQALPYGPWSVSLAVAGAMLLIAMMRSPVAPAISAALLPVVLGVTSWWYPASIVGVTSLLAMASMAWSRTMASEIRHPGSRSTDAQDDEMERAPRRYSWLPVFVGFLLVAFGLSVATGMRMILFPPLVVIAYEMFAHAHICPWAKRPLLLPLACTITAGAGLAALALSGPGPLSVVVSMLAGIAALRAFRLHIPPALAVGLLPQVMPHADWHFPLAVSIGTLTLAGSFLLTRPLLLPRRVAIQTN